MKKTLNNLKQGITIGLGIVLTVGISTVAYGALSSLTATTSETLTATKWNALVEHAVPSGAVMSFNLVSCPTGWSEYTLAYGRFIRGIDKSGTNIDPDGERALGNIQNDDFKSHNHTVNPPSTSTNTAGNHTHSVSQGSTGLDSVGPGTTNAWGGSWYHKGIYIDYAGNHTHTLDIAEFNSGNIGGSETRSKNISLLYCVKD